MGEMTKNELICLNLSLINYAAMSNMTNDDNATFPINFIYTPPIANIRLSVIMGLDHQSFPQANLVCQLLAGARYY